MDPQMVMYEDDHDRIVEICDQLVADANARVVFLVDKNGQLIAHNGEVENIDTTALASLVAGNIAASGGLAKLLGEKDFSTLFHEGENENLHISVVGQRVILAVIFNRRTTLGLVRLRVRKASAALEQVFESLLKRQESSDVESPLADITDDDIDRLFSE